MRVGADQGVGEGVGAAVFFAGPDGAAQVLKVDLVADASARRHHAEVVEGVLAPAQEGIAFAVALHLDVDVFQQHFQRHRQALQVAEAEGGVGQAVIVVETIIDRQGLEGFQAIERGHYQLLLRR
ncbi:hypothetical protein D3C85_1519750 [compost metagenome]